MNYSHALIFVWAFGAGVLVRDVAQDYQDAKAVAGFAEFSPCATIRQFGPGEAYWHHGHVYECAAGTRNPPHALTAPVAQ